MVHTLRREIPPPRCPHLWLFQFLVLVGLFYISSGLEQVSKAVKEMATLSCGYNISVAELTKCRIYWQKDHKMVMSIISGTVTIWPEYKNRTILDIDNNLSLVILALNLSDKGTYTCVVQKIDNGSYKREHLISVMLSIRADFPVPNITELKEPSPFNVKRIKCSTAGGFPKPHISWWENGEELNTVNTTISQNPETELYTVSSELEFNVTSNHSLLCLVKYGNSNVSQRFTWRKPTSAPLDNQALSWGWLCFYIVIPVAFVITVVFLCKKLRRWSEARVEMRRPRSIYQGPAEAQEQTV